MKNAIEINKAFNKVLINLSDKPFDVKYVLKNNNKAQNKMQNKSNSNSKDNLKDKDFKKENLEIIK